MSSAYAQSNLPQCQTTNRNNCVDQILTDGGTKYIGEFKDNVPNGRGKYFFPSGLRYEGEILNDYRHGRGTIYKANGEIFQSGIYEKGILVRSIEESVIKDSSLLRCQTTNRNNCVDQIVTDRGTRYIGEFRNNTPNGRGKYFFPSGLRYEGEILNDYRHGRGTIYKANGEIFQSGIFEAGVFVRSIEAPVYVDNHEKFLQDQQSRASFTAPSASELQIIPPQIPILTITGKRLALVIGNQAYNVRPLLNPRNDADDMSRALKIAGFEVIDVRDASLAQMRNAVRHFGDRLLTRDVGLVYYSGHGIEVRGRNYFIPVNADIKRSDEIADQSLDVNLILEKMETAKKGINILIVDACRDDPFGRSFRSSSRGLANMDAPQGTIIAFATSPGKVAADGDGRNSPYTKNLIKTMQIPNLPIEQVFKQVRRAVQQETKNQQTPWENTSLSGDFYFSVKK